MSQDVLEYADERQRQRAEAAAGLARSSGEQTEPTASVLPGMETVVRLTPVALVATGVGGLVLGLTLPSASFLTALGGASLFLAALIGAVRSPRSSITTDAAFASVAANQSTIVDGLGLSGVQVYVPTGADPPVRLYVPRNPDAEVPHPSALASSFVRDGEGDVIRGLSLETTGVAIAAELSVLGAVPELPSSPVALFEAVRKLLVERVGLVEGSTATVDTHERRAVVSFTGTRHEDVVLLDHPASAFVAVLVALRLDRPVTVSTILTTDDEIRIRYSWPLG